MAVFNLKKKFSNPKYLNVSEVDSIEKSHYSIFDLLKGSNRTWQMRLVKWLISQNPVRRVGPSFRAKRLTMSPNYATPKLWEFIKHRLDNSVKKKKRFFIYLTTLVWSPSSHICHPHHYYLAHEWRLTCNVTVIMTVLKTKRIAINKNCFFTLSLFVFWVLELGIVFLGYLLINFDMKYNILF